MDTVWESPSLFQHDCVSVHKASSIDTRLDEFSVKELPWPAQSPDFKPIKHFLVKMEQRLQARPSRATSVTDLVNDPQKECAQIPTETR